MTQFSQWAPTWHDPNGPMKMLHQLHALRMNYMYRFLQGKDLRGLDVGCGGGLVSLSLFKDMGLVCDGIDRDYELVKIATQKSHEEQVPVNFYHVEDLALYKPRQLYDFVCCFEVIEHVDQKKEFISNIMKLLKPGGIFFISTINRTVRSYLSAILGAEYILKFVPIGTHNYQDFVTLEELFCMLEPAKCLDMRGAIYNPLDKTFFLGESLDINYIAAFEKTTS